MLPTRFHTLLAISLPFAAASAPAAPPTLLADLNTQAAAASSSPTRVAWAPGSAIPTDLAIIRTTPFALWLTNGLPNGARSIQGTLPSIFPSTGFTVNAARTSTGRVALTVSFTSQSTALYGVDAATAVATLLADNPNLSSTILPAGDRFVFTLPTAANGRELWATDGTPQGTTLLADLIPGPADSNPTLMTSTGALAWFSVKRSAADPRELWVTDGTPAGTRAIGPLSVTNAAPTFITAAPLGNGIVYTARDSGASTSAIYTVSPTGVPQALTAAGLALAHTTGPIVSTGMHVLFTASVNNVAHLYVSDGTSANTTSISETALLATTDHAVAVDPAAPLGWRVYFGGGTSVNSTEPCVTDGTRAGTRQIAELIPGSVGSSPGRFTANGARALYQTSSYVSESFSYTGTTYLSDGTAIGTIDLATLPDVPERPTPIVTLDSGTLVSARDARGTELWSFSPNIFTFLSDLDQRAISSSSPLTFPGDNQTTIIAAYNGTTNQALFRTDGTSAGTSAVTTPVGAISASAFSCPQQIGVFGDRLTVFAGTTATGEEPWTIDRNTGAASLVRDTIAGPSGALDSNSFNNCIGWFTAAQLGTRGVFVSRAVVTAGNPNAMYAVWTTDGAPGGAGTVQLATFQRGPIIASGPLFNFTVAGNLAFFIAPPQSSEPFSSTDTDLWITNGTSAQRVIDFSALGLSVPQTMTGWNGFLYFVSTQSGRGRLFRTDGVAPHSLVALGAEADALSIQWVITTARGLLFQASVPGTSPVQSALWFTDTSPGNAVRLTPDVAGFQPTSFMDADPLVFFVQRDVAHGKELWVTDLTLAGTRLAADIYPGPFSSDPAVLRSVGAGRVVVSAYKPGLGVELWQSDGTPFGTRLVGDIASGEKSSSPAGARRLGDRLIFAADDQTETGRELWGWDITPVCRCDLDNSGAPTLQDLFDYLGLFFTASADFNNDGATTVQDIFDFLTCWFGGCV